MRRTSLIFALLLLVAACSESASDSSAVRPFEEVQASEFFFGLDPTDPNRGIFRVETTEPMICAIVWGEDESLGNLNNSLTMSGTGIIDHDVFLPGARPGVEYHFVVQGTTADGTLYRSPMATFVLPAPEATGEESEDRENLAQHGTIISVSSEFSSAFAASNALDGNVSTEWSSAGDGDDASITVDLGEPQTVSGLAFLTRTMADGSAVALTYTVTVDGELVLGPFPAGNPAEPQTANVAVTGQVFTFDVDTSTGGNTGAVEILILAG